MVTAPLGVWVPSPLSPACTWTWLPTATLCPTWSSSRCLSGSSGASISLVYPKTGQPVLANSGEVRGSSPCSCPKPQPLGSRAGCHVGYTLPSGPQVQYRAWICQEHSPDFGWYPWSFSPSMSRYARPRGASGGGSALPQSGFVPARRSGGPLAAALADALATAPVDSVGVVPLPPKTIGRCSRLACVLCA